MNDLWLIGIGTGNPNHVTLEGRKALQQAGTILVPRKGTGKEDLADLRLSLIEACGAQGRVIYFEMPVRDEALPYLERVDAWHDDIARCWVDAVAGHPGPVALLVWGDPGLYDSTLRIARRMSPPPCLKVVPGITALQALTAAHAISFNTVNGEVRITTGRNLRDHGWPEAASSVFVMLDGACSFQGLVGQGLHIWWGAYLGMPQQILETGPLDEVCERIVSRRAEARAAHGWLMDTYLLAPCTER